MSSPPRIDPTTDAGCACLEITAAREPRDNGTVTGPRLASGEGQGRRGQAIDTQDGQVESRIDRDDACRVGVGVTGQPHHGLISTGNDMGVGEHAVARVGESRSRDDSIARLRRDLDE